MLYLGKFLVDLLKMILLAHFALGFPFEKRRQWLAGSAVLLLVAITILYNTGADNRVVYKTVLILTLFFFVFSFSRIRRFLAGILLLTFVDTIDSLLFAMIICVFEDGKNDELVGVAVTFGSLAVPILLGLLCRRVRADICEFLESLPIQWYIVSIFLTFCGGGLIGYAQNLVMVNAALDAFQQAGFVCASFLGISIFLLLIMLLRMKKQKNDYQALCRYNDVCLQNQAAQYAFMGKREDDLRAFRHDYNAHMHAIGQLLQEEKYEELKTYVEEIHQFKDAFKVIQTGNLIVDAILNQYYAQCMTAGIAFSVSGVLGDDDTLTQTELCILFSNAMKNAYEAASKATGEKFIDIKIGTYVKYVDVTIANTTNLLPKLQGGSLETSKEDKVNHGFGTRNMRRVIEKYHGKIEWKADDANQFVLHFSWFRHRN